MKTSALLAFVAAGIAIALLVRRRYARAARRAENPEAAPQATTLASVATEPPVSEPPAADLSPDDHDGLAPSPMRPELEEQTDADALRRDGAAPAAYISDHGDEPTTSHDPDGDMASAAADQSHQIVERADAEAERTAQNNTAVVIAEPTVPAAKPPLATALPTADAAPLGIEVPDELAEIEPDSHKHPPSAPAPRESRGALDADVPSFRADPSDQVGSHDHADEGRAFQGDTLGPIAEPTVQLPDSPGTPESPTADAARPEVPDQLIESESDSEGLPQSAVTPRAPRQYRPPRSTPTRPGERRPPPAVASTNGEKRLDIQVRFVFERGGFCRLSLIPQKDELLDGEITASSAIGEIELVPLQDDLYSDVFPAELGSALRNGLEWTAATASVRVRWTLTGREVYVLGQDEHLSGYLSMPHALLGATHVVLCTDERAAEVSEIIAASGSPQPTVIQQAEGLPAGWKGFGGVSPLISIPQSVEHDILNVLRPRPDISIALEGGIRIGRNTWLAEYPPQIHVRGTVPPETGVLIDGVRAVPTEAEAYMALGWDTVGEHTIWCADQSRTYQIKVGLETWADWDAHRWSLEGIGSDGMAAQPSLCGPLVRAPHSSAVNRVFHVVSASNPVLIGAMPGHITLANMRGALRVREGIASVPFDPVWALPANPFHCDKKTARVIALADQPPVEEIQRPCRKGREELRALRAWCDAILDTARKRITTEPDNPEVGRLWAEYGRRAKLLRKRFR